MAAGHTNLHRRCDAQQFKPLSIRTAEMTAREQAQIGSDALRDGIWTMFANFEEHHRLPTGAGQVLMLQTGMCWRA
jgi:hypothetical protein